MRISITSTSLRRIVVALCIAVLLPSHAVALAQSVETSFTNEEYDVTIEWTDSWDMTSSPDPDSTIISLERDKSIITVIAILDGASIPPEDAVWLMYQGDSGDEILVDRSTEDIPSLTILMTEPGLIYMVESYFIDDGATTILVAVGTVPVLQTAAFDIAQNDITINGNQPFQASSGEEVEVPEDLTGLGTPEAVEEGVEETGRTTRTTRGSGETPEATETAEATEESTSRTSRTSRTTSETPEATETAEATEESTSVITRTPRQGSGETETPEATEVATEESSEPTEEVVESQTLDTYTGPVYGYTIQYDPSIWELEDTIDSFEIDGVRLDADTGTVFFIGTNEYGPDPVGCLEEEAAYYGEDNERISNWEVALDANGDPLWFESDELAWGVFTYTYTTSSGQDVEFVDYISCESIPGEDAVLIVQLTSLPDDYNANLSSVLDVLDTIEFQP